MRARIKKKKERKTKKSKNDNKTAKKTLNTKTHVFIGTYLRNIHKHINTYTSIKSYVYIKISCTVVVKDVVQRTLEYRNNDSINKAKILL